MPLRVLRSFLLFTICSVIYVEGSEGNVKTLMEMHEVVPDVIAEAPQSTLNVMYDGGIIVESGIELTPSQVKYQPIITWESDTDLFYTLMMISPDTPKRAEPTMKEFLNWVVVNIPGSDMSKGDIITEYVGAGPPDGTGLHRYIFLLYEQSGRMEFDEERLSSTTSKGRFYFSTKKFVEKYNLGVPIAGNFFQSQYDDYVPILHKQIGVTFDITN